MINNTKREALDDDRVYAYILFTIKIELESKNKKSKVSILKNKKSKVSI